MTHHSMLTSSGQINHRCRTALALPGFGSFQALIAVPAARHCLLMRIALSSLCGRVPSGVEPRQCEHAAGFLTRCATRAQTTSSGLRPKAQALFGGRT